MQAPEVPPSSKVEVALSLLEVHRTDKITDDGLVVKKSLRTDPDQYEQPRDGAKCHIKYTGTLEGGAIFDASPEGGETVVDLDAEQVSS